MLLGALIRELPDVFEAEVLTKLSVKDHLTLAQVNKECKDFVYKIPPFDFMRMCRYYDDSNIYSRAALQRVYKAVVIGRLDVLKWLWERHPSWRGRYRIGGFILQLMESAAEILKQGRGTEAEVPV